MLKHTFLHLPGVGQKKERALWKAGILTWEDYERTFPPQNSLFHDDSRPSAEQVLEESKRALHEGNLDFFAKRLPSREHYRIALEVPERTLFLDIETTGLSFYYDQITLIGASLGDEYFCYIAGSSKKQIREVLSQAKCVVTYNGTAFDLKFIRQEFEDFHLPAAHVDLRFLARSVGLKGGQKEIERQLSVARDTDVEGMLSENAPLLWHQYRMGDHEAGKLLAKYNFADVEGMKTIFDVTLERLSQNGAAPPVTADQPCFTNSIPRLQFAQSRKTVKKNTIFVPKYGGKHGPKITYQELAADDRTKSLRIVGIDLTGSEERPTGWALLDGNQAYTRMIKSDFEIITETINARPHLVSIDSPLSLPKGRQSHLDDDPRREEIGIMRWCERELKRRGVNVYPCLIPSMQRLTARGIRLAAFFRQIGLPVIESYPGAAQDIMDIPRKRAGLEHLKTGLSDFGIRGEFLHNGSTHDEADAVTSAAVGLFFWSGKFEALGNKDEDYLIIPDLNTDASQWRKRLVVGLSGPIASGKTTAAEFLERQGFVSTRFSKVLETLLLEAGVPLHRYGPERRRKELQEFGERVHVDPGQRWLGKQLVASVGDAARIAIDGLRFRVACSEVKG